MKLFKKNKLLGQKGSQPGVSVRFLSPITTLILCAIISLLILKCISISPDQNSQIKLVICHPELTPLHHPSTFTNSNNSSEMVLAGEPPVRCTGITEGSGKKLEGERLDIPRLKNCCITGEVTPKQYMELLATIRDLGVILPVTPLQYSQMVQESQIIFSAKIKDNEEAYSTANTPKRSLQNADSVENSASDSISSNGQNKFITGSESFIYSMYALIFLGAFLLVIFLIMLFYLIRRQCRKRKQRRRMQMRHDEMLTHRSKQKFRVKKILDEMKHCQYHQLEIKFNEESCIICLEKYKKYSEVCITNECTHSFHRKCLYEWYLTTDPTHPFRCPHCNTINRRVFNASISRLSFEDAVEDYRRVPNTANHDPPTPFGPSGGQTPHTPPADPHSLASINVAI
ncbi:unnamed protein product [Moneuplotes crassus]|uniref:RING-type domain-containing protein n=1 Tax=Euplotes crassus TaxID=5936 RepID=A0AAD1Y564_EUPCR|nr:unnamed protein product [Moneuplotes crassus]